MCLSLSLSVCLCVFVATSGSSANSGHYYSYCRASSSRRLASVNDPVVPWFKFNDTRILKTTWDALTTDIKQSLSDTAYLLLYRRLQDDELEVMDRAGAGAAAGAGAGAGCSSPAAVDPNDEEAALAAAMALSLSDGPGADAADTVAKPDATDASTAADAASGSAPVVLPWLHRVVQDNCRYMLGQLQARSTSCFHSMLFSAAAVDTCGVASTLGIKSAPRPPPVAPAAGGNTSTAASAAPSPSAASDVRMDQSSSEGTGYVGGSTAQRTSVALDLVRTLLDGDAVEDAAAAISDTAAVVPVDMPTSIGLAVDPACRYCLAQCPDVTGHEATCPFRAYSAAVCNRCGGMAASNIMVSDPKSEPDGVLCKRCAASEVGVGDDESGRDLPSPPPVPSTAMSRVESTFSCNVCGKCFPGFEARNTHMQACKAISAGAAPAAAQDFVDLATDDDGSSGEQDDVAHTQRV